MQEPAPEFGGSLMLITASVKYFINLHANKQVARHYCLPCRHIFHLDMEYMVDELEMVV